MYTFKFQDENPSFLDKVWNFCYEIKHFFIHPIYPIKRLVNKKNIIYKIEMEPSPHCHHHICLIARLIGKDYKYFCPYYNEKNFMPEFGSEEHDCDLCIYHGMIGVNENNELKLHVQEEFGELYSLKEFRKND